MRYAIVIRKTDISYSAYVPDLANCTATGYTLDEVRENIRAEIVAHIKTHQAEGFPITEPNATVEYVDLDE